MQHFFLENEFEWRMKSWNKEFGSKGLAEWNVLHIVIFPHPCTASFFVLVSDQARNCGKDLVCNKLQEVLFQSFRRPF